MSRGKWTIDRETGKLIDFVEKKIEVNAPRVKTDSMDALEHPCNGRMYDSKSEFRRIHSRNPLPASINNKGEVVRENEWRRFKRLYLSGKSVVISSHGKR